MDRGIAHPDLLTRANKVSAAAVDHDVDRLDREVMQLVDAFVHHTKVEDGLLRDLPSFTQRLVRRGQDRVLHELTALAVEASTAGSECDCARLGSELATLLTLQADAEHRAFAREGLPGDFPTSP